MDTPGKLAEPPTLRGAIFVTNRCPHIDGDDIEVSGLALKMTMNGEHGILQFVMISRSATLSTLGQSYRSTGAHMY
jgi:hypothetical protein